MGSSHVVCTIVLSVLSVLVTSCDPGSQSTDIRPAAGVPVLQIAVRYLCTFWHYPNPYNSTFFYR